MTETQRIAMITGAGSGIGRATAAALARRGYALVLAGRRPEALRETAELLSSTSEDVRCLPTDVTDEAAVDNLFAEAINTFGRVDLLFNNAGTGAREVDIEALAVADWQRVINANLTGAFLCARAAFRVMKNQRPPGGRIINNGSISARSPRPQSAPYTASKHAITGLTRSLALDGRAHGIACGQIDIGNAAAGLGQDMAQGKTQADGTVRPEATMDVAHVGEAVCFMASLPLSANVQQMTILATQMPFVGRG